LVAATSSSSLPNQCGIKVERRWILAGVRKDVLDPPSLIQEGALSAFGLGMQMLVRGYVTTHRKKSVVSYDANTFIYEITTIIIY
jgi:hypothetical protein